MSKIKNTLKEIKPSNLLNSISNFSLSRKILIAVAVAAYYYFRYYNV
jgi:hypothetical protein